MLITKTSIYSGLTRTMEIGATHMQVQRWQNGEGNIQDIMPQLSADEREFLITGMTPEEWDHAFGEEG